MTLLFILYILHQVSLAVGLSSSLIVDVFLIVVQKSRHIRSIEKGIIDRVLSYAFICAVIIFGIEIGHVFYIAIHPDATAPLYAFSAITTLISACLLFCVASQKYYQVRQLFRYQEKHQHLSNSFISHHKELKYTAILSVLLWIALYICYVIV
jgi:hypothetical protein